MRSVFCCYAKFLTFCSLFLLSNKSSAKSLIWLAEKELGEAPLSGLQNSSLDGSLEGLADSEEEGFSDDELEQQLRQDQAELLLNRKGDVRLEIGGSYPWQEIGLGMSWLWKDTSYVGIVLSRGTFNMSDQRDGMSLNMETSIHSLSGAYRHYLIDYPFYAEFFSGVGFWNGAVIPSGFDADGQEENANIQTDFSHYALSLGARIGFYWQWDNNLEIDISILQFSAGNFIDESFTNSSSTVRKSLRSQVRGPYFWPGINFAIVYRISEKRQK